ncbi:hypothetical protein SKAU_G00006520 [Synaphobranchus kaupii]|uniref:Uncharacterized protein n=1 Tax=Synaphobranchus kaupii TaxID=118154 RepID=A0A9Q1JD31_SYNKA|nr:hypothetical protein SKAU_G00006520 [Synaphobranchus kaupii]
MLWKDCIPNNNILADANSICMEAELAQCHLRWLCHTIRMSEDRLPRQALHGQLSSANVRLGARKRDSGQGWRQKPCFPQRRIQTALTMLQTVSRPLCRGLCIGQTPLKEESCHGTLAPARRSDSTMAADGVTTVMGHSFP